MGEENSGLSSELKDLYESDLFATDSEINSE